MIWYGVFYEDGEKFFDIYETSEKAEIIANNIACMGIEVTVFRLIEGTNRFEELYTI